MKQLLVFAALLLLSAQAEAFEVSDLRISAAGSQPVAATVFSADESSLQVKVLSATQLRKPTGYDSAVNVSVRDLARRGTSLRSVISRPPRSDLLLLNGGFSGSQADRPVGLLVVGGKTLSIPSYSRIPGERSGNCPHVRNERYRLSGLFCVRDGGQILVTSFSDGTFASCREAIQAGPVLIEQRQVAVCPKPVGSDLAARTAVCTDRAPDGRSLVKFVVTRDPISLHDLASWMQKPPERGGLGCDSAINLSGDDSSGAAFFQRNSKNLAADLVVGEGSYPQASFLAVISK